jgi:protein-S-isoprenylcysteine O-methyltransferase Ste14
MEQKRRMFPPVWLLLALVAMWIADRWLPIVELASTVARVAGGLLVVVGIGIGTQASNAFKRAGTPVIPFERSTALVTAGLFRYTRNPMYLGMVLLLVGVALLLGSLGAWLPIPVFVAIIQVRFIAGEERFLTELFGDEYLAYKRTTRRWL